MQCGYCSSCLLRRQGLAVHGIEDHTGYIATACPTENQAPWQLSLWLNPFKYITPARPAENQVSLWPTHAHRLAMLRQVEDLRAILRARSPWYSLMHKYPRLADVVDQTAPYTGMVPEVMRERLMHLYQTYVCEWDNNSVRERLGGELPSSARMQGAA
jgi:hypothetical protein